MPRRRKATLVIFNPGDAGREVMTGIAKLVEFAGTPGPNDDPDPVRQKTRERLLYMAQHGYRAPTVIPDFPPLLPDWCDTAEQNLDALIHARAVYLRACEVCGDIFVCHDKRQRNCRGETCVRAATAMRVQRLRKIHRERATVLKAAMHARDVARTKRRTP